MSYIRKFQSTLPEAQEAYLDDMLRRMRAEGRIESDTTMRRIMDSISISTDGSPLSRFTRVPPNSRIADSGYNSLMDTILIDLNAIFHESNASADTIGRHESISKEWTSDINKSMDIMEGMVGEFKKLVGNADGYTGVRNENFTEVGDAVLLGTKVSGSTLIISPSTTYGFLSSRNVLKVTTTPYPAENHAAGIYMAAPTEFDVANDYGGSRGTWRMLGGGTSYPGYWLSIVLTGEEVRSIIDGATYNGYVNILRIFFTSSLMVNELAIDPVGKYRTYIRRVRYRPPGSDWVVLTYTNDGGDTAMVRGSSYGSQRHYFPPTDMEALEIMFNAVDSDTIRFQFDPSVIRTALLWDELTDREYEYLTEEYTGPAKDRIVGAASEDTAGTGYLSRTIIGMDNVGTLNDTLATVRSSLNIDTSTELEAVGLDAAVLTDQTAAAALGDHLTTINKYEYTLGAYSILPELIMYPPSGVYISHGNTGYDTIEGTTREVALETTQHTPALTTIEYYIVTDTGLEVPIVPRGTTTYRERIKGTVDAAGGLTFNVTFTPVGDVTLYRWAGTKVEVGTATPTGNEVTYSSLSQDVDYVVEYTLETVTESPYLVDIPAAIPAANWSHGVVTPNGYTVPLDVTPYVDYDYYDWTTGVWRYASGLVGYYSDPGILTKDTTAGVWSFPGALSDVSFISATQDTFTASGTFAGSGTHRITYIGTGGEYNEYTHSWDIYTPTASGMEFTLSSGNLVSPSTSVNSNLYEPISLFINGSKAVDRTNYREDTQDPLDNYDAISEYQYYMLGGRLYTNTDFNDIHRTTSIRYRYLSAYLQLKVVMYTNIRVSYYTPRLDDYQLKFMGEL